MITKVFTRKEHIPAIVYQPYFPPLKSTPVGTVIEFVGEMPQKTFVITDIRIGLEGVKFVDYEENECGATR